VGRHLQCLGAHGIAGLDHPECESFSSRR
jgi:hypothetical protein